jgi:hypothetical protein
MSNLATPTCLGLKGLIVCCCCIKGHSDLTMLSGFNGVGENVFRK